MEEDTYIHDDYDCEEMPNPYDDPYYDYMATESAILANRSNYE